MRAASLYAGRTRVTLGRRARGESADIRRILLGRLSVRLWAGVRSGQAPCSAGSVTMTLSAAQRPAGQPARTSRRSTALAEPGDCDRHGPASVSTRTPPDDRRRHGQAQPDWDGQRRQPEGCPGVVPQDASTTGSTGQATGRPSRQRQPLSTPSAIARFRHSRRATNQRRPTPDVPLVRRMNDHACG